MADPRYQEISAHEMNQKLLYSNENLRKPEMIPVQSNLRPMPENGRHLIKVIPNPNMSLNQGGLPINPNLPPRDIQTRILNQSMPNQQQFIPIERSREFEMSQAIRNND